MSSITIADLHRIFDKLDENKDGVVSLNELTSFLEKTGFKHTRNEELEELLAGKQSLDPIDFCFFHDAIMKRMGNNDNDNHHHHHINEIEKDLVEAFRVFDLNGDGFISYQELEIALTKMGLWDERCGKDCKMMIQKYDSNSDGMLDFEEFKNMMFLSC